MARADGSLGQQGVAIGLTCHACMSSCMGSSAHHLLSLEEAREGVKYLIRKLGVRFFKA